MVRIDHEENPPKGRFVLFENEEFAGEMTYSWAGETFFIIDHTLVEEQFAGKGFGKKLVLSAVDFARVKNVKVLPLCTYAKRVFDTEESINDVMR
jgi:predicted GNAT family acetyltransferase